MYFAFCERFARESEDLQWRHWQNAGCAGGMIYNVVLTVMKSEVPFSNIGFWKQDWTYKQNFLVDFKDKKINKYLDMKKKIPLATMSCPQVNN